MKYLLYIDYEYYGAYVVEQDAIDDGERLDPQSYWIEEQADRCWFDAGLDRPTRAECLDALHDLMKKRGHFIPEG